MYRKESDPDAEGLGGIEFYKEARQAKEENDMYYETLGIEQARVTRIPLFRLSQQRYPCRKQDL